MANQLSGDRPRALERRKAISELMLLFAFKMRLKVEGDTPSLKASCLPVISKGTRYTSLINSHGNASDLGDVFFFGEKMVK